jgi:serine/threonine protein kinase
MPDLGVSGITTDLFSFACVVYLVLTGDEYFPADTPIQAMLMMREKKRRSILEGRALSPELRKRPEACRAIDSILARATALAPDQRHQDAQELANALGPWLTEHREPPKPSRRLVNSLLNLAAPGDISRWFEERFMLLRATAFQDPTAFFHRLAILPEEEARGIARRIWRDVNELNLVENILPSRQRADVIVRKDADHRIDNLWLRKL